MRSRSTGWGMPFYTHPLPCYSSPASSRRELVQSSGALICVTAAQGTPPDPGTSGEAYDCGPIALISISVGFFPPLRFYHVFSFEIYSFVSSLCLILCVGFYALGKIYAFPRLEGAVLPCSWLCLEHMIVQAAYFILSASKEVSVCQTCHCPQEGRS